MWDGTGWRGPHGVLLVGDYGGDTCMGGRGRDWLNGTATGLGQCWWWEWSLGVVWRSPGVGKSRHRCGVRWEELTCTIRS